MRAGALCQYYVYCIKQPLCSYFLIEINLYYLKNVNLEMYMKNSLESSETFYLH